MKFYIVTPTFNSLEWLQRCVRSVADQVCDGVQVHHHVQDGVSKDGTPEWLAQWQQYACDIPGYTFSFESARDRGMYDAINIAWSKMPDDADVTAHLNSDEQYLPQALARLAEAFAARPEADIMLASHIVLDAQDCYICHRWPVSPWRWVSQNVCEMITCACFHRVGAFRRHGLRFGDSWRSIGDLVLYRDILSTCPTVCTLPGVFSTTFTVTGNNLGWSEVTEREWLVYRSGLSPLSRCTAGIARLVGKFKRRLPDFFNAAPKEYAVYPVAAECRTRHEIKCPTSHWGCRSEGQAES